MNKNKFRKKGVIRIVTKCLLVGTWSDHIDVQTSSSGAGGDQRKQFNSSIPSACVNPNDVHPKVTLNVVNPRIKAGHTLAYFELKNIGKFFSTDINLSAISLSLSLICQAGTRFFHEFSLRIKNGF